MIRNGREIEEASQRIISMMLLLEKLLVYLLLSVDTTVSLFKSNYKLVIDAAIKPCVKPSVCLSIINLKKKRYFK